jgi:hypothetical protein
MQNSARTPSGYPVVDVDHGEDPFANGSGHMGSVGSRWRSLRVSGWEIALWVMAVVLIVASIQLSVYATQQLYMGNYGSNCDSDGVCTTPSVMVYLQAALSLAPAGLAAGLLSAVAAIAIRAVDAVARHRAVPAVSLTAESSSAPAPRRDSLDARPTGTPPFPVPASPISAPSVPVPAAAHLPRSSFARPTTPPADTDLSAFQRPNDAAGA